MPTGKNMQQYTTYIHMVQNGGGAQSTIAIANNNDVNSYTSSYFITG